MDFSGYSDTELQALGAIHTAREIGHQCAAWRDTMDIVQNLPETVREQITAFMLQPGARILFTGAGTSAFIGNCLAPTISEQLGVRAEAIATTDLVSTPYSHFETNTPTLLISFARSGNSPESLATVQLAEKCISNLLQVVVTCSKEGVLYKHAEQSSGIVALLTPPQTNDQSFAMTSSFTSMMLLAGMLLAPDAFSNQQVVDTINATEMLLTERCSQLKTLAKSQFQRVVFLGSGPLKALAQEAALKLLELTDGKIVAIHDSPLGFRHGPKTFVDAETLVVLFMSSNPHTRNYDGDLLDELRADNAAAKIVAVSSSHSDPGGDSMQDILVKNAHGIQDHLLCFPYIVAAQLYAFFCSLALHNKPDSPSGNGTVNRVVKGVTIYPYAEKYAETGIKACT